MIQTSSPLFQTPLRRVAACVLATVVLAITIAGVTAQTPTEGLSSLPAVTQVTLTEETARNALFAFRDLKARYGDELPDANETESWNEGMARYADVSSTVQSYGFSGIEDWHTTMASYMIAHLMGVEGGKAEMEAGIQQIEASEQLPESMKEQLISRISQYMPSDENVAIAQSLSTDPDIMAAIDDVRD